MITHTLRYTMPAAYALLPDRLGSPPASALLLAIGLQESQFLERRQREGGPARGLWMFEKAGIAGVLTHAGTASLVASALYALRYERALNNPTFCYDLVEDNDTLACVFARLLLFTLPEMLPDRTAAPAGWAQYQQAWRPGRPRPATWDANFREGWDRVDADLGRRMALV